MARLRGGRPTVLQILPLPRGQFLGRMWIIFLWAVSAFTLTMAGFVGTKASRPTDGVISSSGFADAFLLTALPVLGLVALASIVQVGVARSRGVRVGPIVPVPDPSILLWATGALPAAWLVWPFGIFVLPTLPRMDARPWQIALRLAGRRSLPRRPHPWRVMPVDGGLGDDPRDEQRLGPPHQP